MIPVSLGPLDFSPEPDLHPLYPSSIPSQKSELVSHSLSRACVFGDLSLLQYLLSDHQSQLYIDLSARDEDGLSLISLAILGFGSESERDVEREECVRLLIAQGADATCADKAGWTALHHAAILCPPTLVSHLMTHGCSPFAETRRRLTPLDIVTAHTVLPGRDDIALLLEEAMRSQGWMGGRMEEKRRALDEQLKRKGRQKSVRENVSKVLGLQNQWWNSHEEDEGFSSDDEDDEDDQFDEELYLSRPSHTSVRNSQPAITLYLMARFACLTCDQTWLEDLVLGATDAIEEKFFSRSEDITCLVFCLYNATIWLHLMQCDNAINEGCEMLGSFELLEQVINSVFDQLLDAAILDSSPVASEFESVQFESEWSFLRPFSAKKKSTTNTPNHGTPKSSTPSSPPFLPSRPPSPSPLLLGPAPVPAKGLSSLRQTLSRAKTPSTAFNTHSDVPKTTGLRDLTSFLTALHTLLTLSDVNPVLMIQFWSQVMYWTSCEIFNRILTRKKYLCRSKAVQIGMNLVVLEEWIEDMGLPRGIASHLTPVRDLLNWLQCLSSITDFSNLVATIQTMKSINPLQMRRAVRDYKYEVHEGRMTDECIQYLTQLQKDWERHRVKMGVEALRKEMGERERERELEDGMASEANASFNASSETFVAQHSIDNLFDRSHSQSEWEPAKAPQVLGELLDSRHMLPLFLPSDPRVLSATPEKRVFSGYCERAGARTAAHARNASQASTLDGGAMKWRCRSRRVRNVDFETLQWVDRFRTKPQTFQLHMHGEEYEETYPSTPLSDAIDDLRINTDVPHTVLHGTPLTKRPSARSRGRLSLIGDPVIPITL
ncbi:DIL domain-containing protein [Suillus subalutaceus]|uniref:DIL domain-containing protein n=1 Tax=Suillus subalutaceus TaxID=48586 RepID=UPI001B88637E|nr:DIL domain-containing protein [Suillus subalutaceus]KAG1864289.1 DIL domain-containing protein [Suillus subalutaceus]